jgi:tetratricopeptide (TPR) repeat protein
MRRSANRFVIASAVAAVLACTVLAPDARAAGDEATETVEQLAERAYALQTAGKDAEAITIYLKAYDLAKDGILLLNVARLYDTKLHEPALAAEYYRRYLLSPDSDADRVKKVTDRLAVLRREAEEERTRMIVAPPAPVPQSPSAAPAPPAASHETGLSSDGSAPSRGGPMRTAGVVVGALGVVGVGATFVLGYVAKTKNDSANAICNGRVCESQDGVNLTNTAQSFATASTASLIAGLVLVAGGVTIFALAPRGARPSQAASISFAPLVDVGGAGGIGTGTGTGILVHGAF